MTDTMSTVATVGGAMDVVPLKDNCLVMDMSSANSMLHHNAIVAHAHVLHNLKAFDQNTAVDADNRLENSTSLQQQQQQQTAANLTANSLNGVTSSSSSSSTNAAIATSITSTLASSLSSPAPALTTFRCERCDNFETNSRASLLLHVVQCLSNGAVAAAAAARLKTEDIESVMNTMRENGALSPKTSNSSNTLGNNSLVAVASVGSLGPSTGQSAGSARKVFECDVCNMKFSNGANMRRHKMRHTGVKPYECRVCQKRFFRKDHLAEHFTTHTKTLPYHCPICNRGFQRQIAMRAHFQNEHVGQHDLVKSCPLCSYRAGSMKSLRIHFYNRHGIDLDNPGPAGSSSLLLALETQANQVAAAAAAAGFVPTGLNAVAAAAAAAVANAANNTAASHPHSDSSESLRSADNGTPPMHFLTPHVEISTLPDNGMSDNAMFNGHNNNNNNNNNNVGNSNSNSSSSCSSQNGQHTNGNCTPSLTTDVVGKERDTIIQSPIPFTVHLTAPQEHPLDCNVKSMPTSTSNGIAVHNSVSPKSHQHNHHHNHHDNHITPSISLIPIKQEMQNDDNVNGDILRCFNKTNSNQTEATATATANSDNNEMDFSLPNSRLTSLIKVSPLKSLLREDLKRRICAKANHRMSRNASTLIENNNTNITNNNIQSSLTPATGMETSNSNTHTNSISTTPICNGTITSTALDGETGSSLNRKQILTCHFCGIEFPDETLYFLHKGCHCESNPWKCNICGEQCNNVYEFNSHLLSKSHQ